MGLLVTTNQRGETPTILCGVHQTYLVEASGGHIKNEREFSIWQTIGPLCNLSHLFRNSAGSVHKSGVAPKGQVAGC